MSGSVVCGFCGKAIPLRPNYDDPPEQWDEHTQQWQQPDGTVCWICLECLEVKKAEAITEGKELVSD